MKSAERDRDDARDRYKYLVRKIEEDKGMVIEAREERVKHQVQGRKLEISTSILPIWGRS